MEIFTLPNYLGLEHNNSIQVFDYCIDLPNLNSKVNLAQNTISFLREGTKEVFTDQQPVSIENDSFLLMKAGHCLMTENLSPINKAYRSILLFFSDELLSNFIEKQKINSKDLQSIQAIHVCRYDNFIHTFVKSLEDLMTRPKELQGKILQTKFEEIMLYLMNTQNKQFLDFITSNIAFHSKDFLQVVENNKLNKLSLKELAFLSNMSVSTFKRAFEKHFQTSPIKWFQEQRLIHAAYILKNQSQRPSDIFEYIGYESLSTFIHAFKGKYGVTPKQFQNSN